MKDAKYYYELLKGHTFNELRQNLADRNAIQRSVADKNGIITIDDGDDIIIQIRGMECFIMLREHTFLNPENSECYFRFNDEGASMTMRCPRYGIEYTDRRYAYKDMTMIGDVYLPVFVVVGLCKMIGLTNEQDGSAQTSEYIKLSDNVTWDHIIKSAIGIVQHNGIPLIPFGSRIYAFENPNNEYMDESMFEMNVLYALQRADRHIICGKLISSILKVRIVSNGFDWKFDMHASVNESLTDVPYNDIVNELLMMYYGEQVLRKERRRMNQVVG